MRCDVGDKNIIKEYSDSTQYYDALKEDVVLNYQTGLIGLKGKLDDALRLIEKGKYKKLKIDSPAKLLELVAMNYNGNDAEKKDPKQKNRLSQVNYVYARDVILRFKKFTPAEVRVNDYYEYDTIKREYRYVKL